MRIHLVRRKRIDGMRIDKFLDSCEEGRVYLLDMDPYLGREMNFYVYRELSGICDMWIDSAPRKIEDVMDVLVSDAEVAVLMGIYFWDDLGELLDMTENVAMKSIFPRHLEDFVSKGGKIIISSRNLMNEVRADEKYLMKGREVCEWKP